MNHHNNLLKYVSYFSVYLFIQVFYSTKQSIKSQVKHNIASKIIAALPLGGVWLEQPTIYFNSLIVLKISSAQNGAWSWI